MKRDGFILYAGKERKMFAESGLVLFEKYSFNSSEKIKK